jgi:hypothetical protein
MSTVEPVPAPAPVDARSRAARTFFQGLLLDVIVAVVMVLNTAINTSDFAWKRENFVVLAGLLAKTAVMSAVSYVMRIVKPPATT